MNILSAEDKVERMCRHTSQETGHTDTVTGLSALLWGIALSPPRHTVSIYQVSRRVWSHDLDLASRCVPSSLATLIGSGPGR